jgi:hypothetical protein
MWKLGLRRAIPFLGIHKWDFRCNAALVHSLLYLIAAYEHTPTNTPLSAYTPLRYLSTYAPLMQPNAIQAPSSLSRIRPLSAYAPFDVV